MNKKSPSDYARDRVKKYEQYFKDGEILPITELVEAVEPKTLSFVVTDINTKRLAGLKKETFEDLLKTANIPGKYFRCRSFATWDVLLPSEEVAKSLPPFLTVSHSPPASSELTVDDIGGVGPLVAAEVGERLREPPFSRCLLQQEGGADILVGLLRGLLPRANCREVTNLATVPAGRFTSRDDNWKPAPFHIQPVGNGEEGLSI